MLCTSRTRTCTILVLTMVCFSTCFPVMASAYAGGKIGVAYGLNGDDLLTPQQTVALLSSKGIGIVRRYEARPDVTRAFAKSGIDLVIGVPNEEIPKIAASLQEALGWINKYVVPFPTSGISAIIVGNEWLSNPSNDASLLVPAMKNIYKALSKLQFSYLHLGGIKVSTSHALDVLSVPSFPPSVAKFAQRFLTVMRPLVQFLAETGSYFMVNINPYYTYREDKGVALEFALFESTRVVTDPNTGLQYTNLLDLQLDAVYAAISALSSSSTPSSSSSPRGRNSSKAHLASKELLHVEAKQNGRKPRVHVHSGEIAWPANAQSSGTNPRRTHSVYTATSSLSTATSSLPSSSMSSISEMPSLTSSMAASASTNTTSNRSSAASLGLLEEGLVAKTPYALKSVDIAGNQCRCTASATVENARTFNQNLIQHVLRAKGTPANPSTPIFAYIFELFNENLKPPGPEQHFGLFFPNGTAVYPIDFTDGHTFCPVCNQTYTW